MFFKQLIARLRAWFQKLFSPTPAVPIRTGLPLQDGRYRGANAQLSLELRVDFSGSGVISADIYRQDWLGQHYVASLRTSPGSKASADNSQWTIIGEDEHGGRATGTLSLGRTAGDPDTVQGEFYLENALHSLPVRRAVSFTAAWEVAELRGIGIELEREESVAPLPQFAMGDTTVSLAWALQKAGITMTEAGLASAIPDNGQGWGNTQLHTLLRDFAQASLSQRAWEIHLLLLSRATREGLLGIMFDTQDHLPRQGTAVFATAIRQRFAAQADRKLLQTTIHELGHALNLAHRFEREVGRADSLSFMNYDWRYKGGRRRDEYWSLFDFSFDDDELEFIRHAPLPALIPGGAAFHSINYWADGNGGYSPYVPEAPLPGYRLVLRPPLDGPVFTFGQPVFLEVELSNETGQPLELPPMVLDPKAGFLEVLIKRWTGAAYDNELADAHVFVPILQRCFDVDAAAFDNLPDGSGMRDNLNLTFGSGGFAFAEPGIYDVTALLAIYDQARQMDRVVRSNTLRIQVGVPKSAAEEKDGLVLLRNDVGLYFALGGSDGLEQAASDLEEIRQKRHGKRKDVVDPVVANIVRCQGINAARSYTRYRDGRFTSREGDRATAAARLEMLGSQAMKAFDRSTAVSTRRLAVKHRKLVAV